MSIADQIKLYVKLLVAYKRTVQLNRNTGLCKACETLFLPYYTENPDYQHSFGLFTKDEFVFLSEELRVETARRLANKEMFDAFYWFDHQDTQSRINYVNNKINELKSQL